jgi:hypothetical protein
MTAFLMKDVPDQQLPAVRYDGISRLELLIWKISWRIF